jgi:hypothetical protein
MCMQQEEHACNARCIPKLTPKISILLRDKNLVPGEQQIHSRKKSLPSENSVDALVRAQPEN